MVVTFLGQSILTSWRIPFDTLDFMKHSPQHDHLFHLHASLQSRLWQSSGAVSSSDRLAPHMVVMNVTVASCCDEAVHCTWMMA